MLRFRKWPGRLYRRVERRPIRPTTIFYYLYRVRSDEINDKMLFVGGDQRNAEKAITTRVVRFDNFERYDKRDRNSETKFVRRVISSIVIFSGRIRRSEYTTI